MDMEHFIKVLKEDPELCGRIELCETAKELQDVAAEYDVDQNELAQAFKQFSEEDLAAEAPSN